MEYVTWENATAVARIAWAFFPSTLVEWSALLAATTVFLRYTWRILILPVSWPVGRVRRLWTTKAPSPLCQTVLKALNAPDAQYYPKQSIKDEGKDVIRDTLEAKNLELLICDGSIMRILTKDTTNGLTDKSYSEITSLLSSAEQKQIRRKVFGYGWFRHTPGVIEFITNRDEESLRQIAITVLNAKKADKCASPAAPSVDPRDKWYLSNQSHVSMVAEQVAEQMGRSMTAAERAQIDNERAKYDLPPLYRHPPENNKKA